MTNPSTVGEDFQVNGTSLYTLAYNIWTLAGREQTPPVVGDNIAIPYRNGRVWKPKTFDQRTLTLGMWVIGTDVNGVVPAQGMRAQLNSNLRTLKRLFAPRGAQLALQRTLKFVTGTEVHTALGDAYNPSSGGFAAGGGGLGSDQWDFTPVTQTYGTFTVDIVMADPWWYGPQQTPTLTSTGLTVTSSGDVEHDHPVITLNGPLTNPRVSNTSVLPFVQVWYNGTINSGHYLTLDCGAFTAIDDLTNSQVGNVFHAGSVHWMVLEPGNNVMTLDRFDTGGNPGTGNAVITYSPPYT